MKRIQLILSLIIMIPFSVFSQNYFTLSGIITDAQSGKLLKGIDVVVKDQATGTITDYRGSYILYLDKGNYEICYSASGYQMEDIKVDLNHDSVNAIELKPSKKVVVNQKSKKFHFFKKKKTQEILADSMQ